MIAAPDAMLGQQVLLQINTIYTDTPAGCGCKEVYRFPLLLIPTPLVSVLFLQQHPTFCSFKNMFFVLVLVLFCNTFYVLNNFFTQYRHTYLQLRASHGSHMKAAHTVLYMKKHTQTYTSYPAMDISCMSVV